MAEKEKGAGLIVLVTDIDGQTVAIGQKRGAYSTEREMRPSLFAGVTQVTCHGKLNASETPVAGLMRELEEELGSHFADYVKKIGEKTGLTELVTLVNEKKEMTTFGCFVSLESLDWIRLGPSSGGLVKIHRGDLPNVRITNKEMMTAGAPLEGITMFDDELKAVKLAYELVDRPS